MKKILCIKLNGWNGYDEDAKKLYENLQKEQAKFFKERGRPYIEERHGKQQVNFSRTVTITQCEEIDSLHYREIGKEVTIGEYDFS